MSRLRSKRPNSDTIKSNDRSLFLGFTDFAFWSALKTLSENRNLTENNPEIRLFVDKLMNFEELNASDLPELRISVTQSEAYSILSENIIYKNCLDNVKQCFPIFITSKITKHVSQRQFEDLLNNQENGRNADIDDELKKILTIRRLQDGLAVIDESPKKIYLLIDSERSIMPHIYDKYLFILRVYKM